MSAIRQSTTRRTPAALVLAGFVMSATLSLAGCRRANDVGPPQIAFGQAECDLCRMIISEEAFAAAAVIVDQNEVEKVAFDDIGCLLDWLRGRPASGRVISYVHDHQTLQWLDAANAVFVRSESIQTPMASHLAASSSPAGAQDLLRRYPGTSAAFVQLRSTAIQTVASDALTKERGNP